MRTAATRSALLGLATAGLIGCNYEEMFPYPEMDLSHVVQCSEVEYRTTLIAGAVWFGTTINVSISLSDIPQGFDWRLASVEVEGAQLVSVTPMDTGYLVSLDISMPVDSGTQIDGSDSLEDASATTDLGPTATIASGTFTVHATLIGTTAGDCRLSRTFQFTIRDGRLTLD